MSSPETWARKHGMLFQQSVRETLIASGQWTVRSEIPYVSSEGKEKYLDLLAKHRVKKAHHLAIECKKTSGGTWVFFVEDKAPIYRFGATVVYPTHLQTQARLPTERSP